jgi:hypothetical protein
MNEAWKEIQGYNGKYYASTLGRIRSADYIWGSRSMKGRIFNPTLSKNKRYFVVALFKDGIKIYKSVHRIIAETFIPNPKHLPQVNHIDADKTNNSVSNLEWVTAKENHKHAILNNLKAVGSKHYKSLLTEDQVIEIRKSNQSTKDLAQVYGMSYSGMRYVQTKKTYKHI